jgi:hypothetical protein
VRSGDFERGGPEPGARNRLPELPLEPRTRNAEPPELGIHLHEIGAADELDLRGQLAMLPPFLLRAVVAVAN